MQKCKRKGFTLVELVIVILILGILAAVAVPKLFNTSSRAVDNGLKSSLGVIRDAIELYAADNAFLPGGEQDLAGDLSDYLRGPFPKCPVGSATNPAGIKYTTTDTEITGEPNPVNGWHYNTKTGEFIVNYDAPTQTDENINYDDY